MSGALHPEQVTELRARLVEAAAECDRLAEQRVPTETARLRGRASGLRLAAQWLDEMRTP